MNNRSGCFSILELMKLLFIGSFFFISCAYYYVDPEFLYTFYKADNPNFQYIGRFDFTNPEGVRFAWPGSTIKINFEGPYCAMVMKQIPIINNNNRYEYNYYNIIIDDNDPTVIKTANTDSIYVVADNLDPGEHTLTIFKRTEVFCGMGEFLGIKLIKDKKILPPPVQKKRKIEFLGNSMTCGYGNEGKSGEKFTGETENSYMSFASITGRALNAEYFLISYSGKGVYVNSDFTLTNTLPDIYNRIIATDSASHWDFSKWTPDAVVINLGINDFSTIAIPDSITFTQSYSNLLLKIDSVYPGVTIFCIDGPGLGSSKIKKALRNQTTQEKSTNRDNKLSSHILAAMETAQKKRPLKVYHFSLSSMETSNDEGTENHPNISQHIKNSNELTQYIKQKMKW